MIDFASAIGRRGGQLYGEANLAKLDAYLGRRGITLRVGDEFLPPGKGGGFDYTAKELLLRSNPTEYEVWHELGHYLQYRSLGPEAYARLSRTVQFNAPEQFVFDLLENSPRRWNSLSFEEQQHAINYIESNGGFR